MSTESLRLLVAIAGVVAAGLLCWRLLATWLDSTVLVHVLGLLLIASVLVGALATHVNRLNDAPPNPVLWLILAHRVACIVVAIMWATWHGRTDPPYRRPFLNA